MANEKTLNELRAMFEDVSSVVKGALHEIARGERAMIKTDDHRAAREAAVNHLIIGAGAVLEAHDALLAAEQARQRGLVHDVDRFREENEQLRERVEACEATLLLYERTAGMLPAVGMVCDGEHCTNAIGVVGVRAIATDAMLQPSMEIALEAGWKVIDGRHLCPVCVSSTEESR
jgi:hypothetical protein